jgi:hypothetical protein
MRWTEFLARYRATEAELQMYTEHLPLWVNVWRGWMFFIFTAAVVFVIWKREARWLAVTMIVSIVAYNVVAMSSGVGRFPSIAFVLLWTPLFLYLARRLPHLEQRRTFDRLYRYWVMAAVAAVATLAISLVFDVYNVAYSLVRGVP